MTRAVDPPGVPLVTWYMQVYRDADQAERALSALRRCCPDDRLLVVSDGDDDARYAEFEDRFGATVVYGSRLQPIEHGGEVCQRMLELFLRSPSDVLIKIDPDTLIRRPFHWLPDRTRLEVRGSPQRAGHLESVQGGCTIIPRRAAAMIAESGLLQSDALKGPGAAWVMLSGATWCRGRVLRLSGHDATLGWCCRALQIPVRRHPEVVSRWRTFWLRDAMQVVRAAVVHPWLEPGVGLPARVFAQAARAKVQQTMAAVKVAARRSTTRVEGFRDRTMADPAFAPLDAAWRQRGGPQDRRDYDALFAYFVAGFARHASPLRSRAFFPGTPSLHGRSIDGLEAFTRLLPLVAAWLSRGRVRHVSLPFGHAVDLVEFFAGGLSCGVDPLSPEWWGRFSDRDQRVVESADLALALWIGRETLWRALDDRARQCTAEWLRQVNTSEVYDNNWHLCVTLVNAVLQALDIEHSEEALLEHYSRFKRFHLGGGWFSDGPPRGRSGRVDYYNAWQIHYVLALLAELRPDLDRAFLSSVRRQFLETFKFLIGPAGFPALGRSLCYRFAVAAPLILGAQTDGDVVSAGLARRALDATWRHFIRRGALANGVPTQGYYGADPRLCERYIGPASSLWSLRSLVAAFLWHDDSAFWVGSPEPLPVERGDFSLEIPSVGWTVHGERSTGRIVIARETDRPRHRPLRPYTRIHRAAEWLRGAPKRPDNFAAAYERAEYASDPPFWEADTA